MTEDQEPKTKRAKIDAVDKASDSPDKPLPFSEFRLDRILFTKAENKSISLLGRFSGSEENGVFVVEKQPITEDSIRELLSCDATVNSSFHNDIYSQHVVVGGRGLGEVRVMGVYPATEKHIAKYSDQKLHIVHESPHLYQTITQPFIKSQAFTIDVSMISKFLRHCKIYITLAMSIGHLCPLCSGCTTSWMGRRSLSEWSIVILILSLGSSYYLT